jgi:hypothetical protein
LRDTGSGREIKSFPSIFAAAAVSSFYVPAVEGRERKSLKESKKKEVERDTQCWEQEQEHEREI